MSKELVVIDQTKALSVAKAEKAIAVAIERAYELISELGEAGDIKGLANVENKLSQLTELARREDVSRQSQNSIAEAKLWTQREAGEVWISLPRDGGSGQIKWELVPNVGTMPDKNDPDYSSWHGKTHRWTLVAEAPLELLRVYIKDVTANNGDELTTHGFLKEAKKYRQSEAARKRAATVAKVDKNVWLGMFQTYKEKIGKDKVDLIFTDPPYDVKAADLYAELSEFAAYVLRPGGVCMAYAGQFTLPDCLINLGQNLEYMWVAGIKHTGGELRFRKYHIHNAWKPILVFYKPPLECWWDWFSDMIEGGGQNKKYHKWGQALSEAVYFIRAVAPKGGVMVDPMCGGGTSLVAAKGLGMQYIGIDVDATAVNNSKHNLSTVKDGQFNDK